MLRITTLHMLRTSDPTLNFFRFSVLIGPINHIKHLVSKERLPFSVAYITSLALTLYFSLGVRPDTIWPLLILTPSLSRPSHT